MSVTLYTIGCPKCKVLETKLKQANISYEEVNDIDVMMGLGFTTAPMLKVDDNIYDFKQAVAWLKQRG